MGFICLKDTKKKLYGIKTSCCNWFRCFNPIGNSIQEYWNAPRGSGAAPITYFDAKSTN
jgi:hypothetical protein